MFFPCKFKSLIHLMYFVEYLSAFAFFSSRQRACLAHWSKA